MKKNIAYGIVAAVALVTVLASYSFVSAQVAPVASTETDSAQTDSIEKTIMPPTPNWNTTINYNATDTETTLTVAGSGYVNLPPDMVSINLGIDTIAPSAELAVQNNTQTMNAILESLKALELDEKEVKTSYFSVYPQYQYDQEGKNPPTISGYQASNNVNIVTKKTEKVAEIIDKTISAGANRVDGPYFSLSQEAQKNLRGEVIKNAIADAEDNAKMMLEMQSLSIKGVKSMSINFGGYPIAFVQQTTLRESSYAYAASGGPFMSPISQMSAMPYISPPPVLPGEQQVSATVLITYVVG